MTNGVLNQRLHDQGRHKCIFHLRSDLYFDAQIFLETKFLDSDVVVEKSQFFCQRNLLSVARLKRQAKQIAQVLDHRARQPRITLHL